MSEKKQFYYMAGEGFNLLRLKQITTLHHVASKLKYDSDTLYMIQNYLLQKEFNPTSIGRIVELRKSLDPKI